MTTSKHKLTIGQVDVAFLLLGLGSAFLAVGLRSQVGRMSGNYTATEAYGQISSINHFLVGLWLILPPIWFLVEFYLAQGSADLQVLKHRHDLLRNVWVAMVLLLMLITGVGLPIGS